MLIEVYWHNTGICLLCETLKMSSFETGALYNLSGTLTHAVLFNIECQVTISPHCAVEKTLSVIQATQHKM